MAVALKAEVEELLKHMAPADAEAQRTIFEKNPKFTEELQGHVLRQADYDRQLNANKEKLKAAEKWTKWGEENYPRATQLYKDFAELEQANQALIGERDNYRDQVQKFNSGELNVDEATLNAKVDARLEGRKYVTDAEMRKVINEEATKLAKEEAVKAAQESVKSATDQFLTQTWPAAQAISQEMNRIQFDHMHATGKPLTDEEAMAIGEQMKANNNYDVRKAYNDWIAPKRQEREIAEKVEAGIKEKMSTMHGFPGVSGVAPELGPVQLKNAGKIPVLPDNAVIGDGSAAAAAAAEMRSEGKL